MCGVIQGEGVRYMYLPSEVILMRDISAGVPMNEPIPPAVTPAHTEKQTYIWHVL